jgi:hypothetical protein
MQPDKCILILIVQVINVLLMSIVIGFFTGFAVTIWAVYDAYRTAERINQQFMEQYALGSGTTTVGHQSVGQPFQPAQPGQAGKYTSRDIAVYRSRRTETMSKLRRICKGVGQVL